MARPLRIEYEGALHYVTARGNERRKTFFSARDYAKFLEYVDEARDKFGLRLHAYVLMSNHYHLLLETPAGNLGRAMHTATARTSTLQRQAQASRQLWLVAESDENVRWGWREWERSWVCGRLLSLN